MSRRKGKTGGSRVKHSGRVTVSECRVRGKGRPCAPLNRIIRWDEDGRSREWCTCTCGRRFRTADPDAPEHLVEPLEPSGSPDDGSSPGAWPEPVPVDESRRAWAADGVVPIGNPALHRPTRPIGPITDEVGDLASHLIEIMHHAPGVGLAANQIGMPVRMFVQVHERAAPQTFVDPEVRARDGVWHYNEGCLSLVLEGSHQDIRRPRRVQVRARTLKGETFEITADEVLARILQHEIDHLDGIMYVQRSERPRRDELYALLESSGIDTSIVPPRPHADLN